MPSPLSSAAAAVAAARATATATASSPPPLLVLALLLSSAPGALAGRRLALSDENRIIDGYQAPSGRYPYSVTLQDGSHFCGGSLIGPDAVLTAAHCLGDTRSIRFGSDSVKGGKSYRVRREREHPDYDGDDTDQYDIGLVFLEESVEGFDDYPRVNDDNKFPRPGTESVTMGWGNMNSGNGGKFPNKLMAVDLEIMSNGDCDDAERGGDSYNNWIYPSMICTSSDDGKDACQGDSGGPLIIAGDDPREDVIVGVVSWGIGCAYMPGVYGRVSRGYDWIQRTVCDQSQDPPPGLCGSPEPTDRPTVRPTPEPTRTPTRRPTRNPTRFPTRFPTRYPTRSPTEYPTLSPSVSPTKNPTTSPTTSPTRAPTVSPTTASPTTSPTESPTDTPSASSAPSSSPSTNPTLSAVPTLRPSDSPSTSTSPSSAPSSQPTTSSQPTGVPSVSSVPSSAPSVAPSTSAVPTESQAPSAPPSSRPSGHPSSQPSEKPSSVPSSEPSWAPSTSTSPSSGPSAAPSSVPSDAPTSSARPTVTGGPTASAAPTRTRIDPLVGGKSLMMSNATKLADDATSGAPRGSGGKYGLGVLLSGFILGMLRP